MFCQDEVEEQHIRIVNACEKEGLDKFTDLSFTFDKAIADIDLSDKKISFQRKEDKQVPNKPLMKDFRQGYLGDCWFISAFAILIKKPHLMEEILLKKDNERGIYGLGLFIDGKRKVVALDNLFPRFDATGKLIFAESDKQIWAPLIEKALAKINHKYVNLESGYKTKGELLIHFNTSQLLKIFLSFKA